MEIRIPQNAARIPHKRHWQFCVGSGHALLALRTDWTKQLKYIHDTLGIERVRFHGIFCDDMRTFNDLSMQMPVPGAEAFDEYNFNACALAYDNVLEAGMKPFVELSFMPEKLALKEEGRPVKGGFFYRHNIVPFIPLHTLGAHADYTWELTKTGLLKSICMGMNVRGTGKTYWNEANTMCQPFYTLIGAHVDARFSDVTLSLWARNITNKRYASFAFESPSTMGGYLRAGQVGEPFTMGVDVRIKL